VKIDLYHLYVHSNHVRLMLPPILDVLQLWTESLGHEITLRVSTEKNICYDTRADVIAISVYTQTAMAAYRIAERFRKNSKIVILGGPHFHGQLTLHEGAAHCDIVVASLCRRQWQELLSGIKSEKIKRGRHRALVIEDTMNEFSFPEDLYHIYRKKKAWQFTLIPASLGCPYRCEFCNPYMPGTYVTRDIDLIVNEIKTVKSPVLGLCDATFGLDKRHTLELMKKIAPLKKQLWIETTLVRLKDTEFLDALQAGGVKWIAVGIESLSQSFRKHGSGTVEDMIHLFTEVNRRGMLIQGNFICGIDSDGPDSFSRIYGLCRKSGINFAYVDLMVPFPTTEIYRRLVDEGRIIDTNWERYDFHHLVYRPEKMSPEELVSGYTALYRKITSPRFLLSKAMQIIRHGGLRLGPLLMVAYSIFTVFDARKKERMLKKNVIQIGDKKKMIGPANG